MNTAKIGYDALNLAHHVDVEGLFSTIINGYNKRNSSILYRHSQGIKNNIISLIMHE